jgi:hypothetical protein
MNMMNMPCPKCGSISNFDGWSGDEELIENLIGSYPKECYDGWSVLKKVFRNNVKDGLWAISPDCRWFKRPDMTEEQYRNLMEYVQEGIYEKDRL